MSGNLFASQALCRVTLKTSDLTRHQGSRAYSGYFQDGCLVPAHDISSCLDILWLYVTI